MSTPPKSDAKAAAKRRALARRRNRVILRYIFAYGIIAILVLGTVSTVLVQTASAPQAVVAATPTTAANDTFAQLLTQADQYVAASQWVSATGLYKAYLSQNPNRADVYLKLGKAVMNSPSPDYLEIASDLQQAVSLAGQDTATSSEAQSLLTQLQPQLATAVAAATATGTVISAQTVTATIALTATSTTGTPSPQHTPIGPVINTPVVTGTIPLSPSPATTP